MTTIPANTLSPQLFGPGTVGGKSEINRGLTFAAALYLAVAIAEMSIIALAAPSIAELGAFYVTAP